MFDNIDNLKLVYISQGKVKPSASVENKKLHSFIIRTEGEVHYDFYDSNMSVKTGEMIFLPKGSSYTHKTMSPSGARYLSITFDAEISHPHPVLYSLDGLAELEHICSHIVNLWNFGSSSDKHKCYSLFYQILSYLCAVDNMDYSEKRKFDTIEPAIQYLKKHIFDCSLKIDDLHTLCGISDTYFRKIFTSKFGCTPQAYITYKRLSYAKNLIETGTAESISDIAISVGYSDALYFSRIFKKKYGSAPTKISEH